VKHRPKHSLKTIKGTQTPAAMAASLYWQRNEIVPMPWYIEGRDRRQSFLEPV